METTMQSSLPNIRSKLALLEAIELASLGFAVWGLGVFGAIVSSNGNFLDLLTFFILLEGFLLGSWALYNGYIRVARAGGRIVDIGIWWIASALTATYTLWAWSILDINRIIISKLLYRGDAPVELALQAGAQSMGTGAKSTLRLVQSTRDSVSGFSRG
jgi:hypothetical protein